LFPFVTWVSKREWPKKVTVGNVTIPVYRVAHATAKSGYAYVVAHRTNGYRQLQKFADADEAIQEARTKATQLAAGRVEGAEMSRSDRDELQAARKMAGKTPLLSAIAEWAEANQLTVGHVLAAAQDWKRRNNAKVKRITVAAAVDAFIAAKDKAKKQGERTYRAKLSPLASHFPERHLDEISAAELSAYLEKYDDPVTRNDFRKRAVALFRWAYKFKYLPQGAPLEIEQTERADEGDTEIGIIDPATFKRLLDFIREKHPKHLAAVVLAGFCGIRADEIHGKRADRSTRQTWDDVHPDASPAYVTVTVAKKNTPAKRTAPLCPAAIAWLKLCPKPHEGPICEGAALERVRLLARDAGFKLPNNCLRHSFITYRIDVTKNKAQVALEAGNSEKEIDARYRAHIAPGVGAAWFSILP
jgi:integrase